MCPVRKPNQTENVMMAVIHARVLRIVLRAPPEVPIGGQHRERDREKVLLQLEEADGVEDAEILERRPHEHPVRRIDPRSEDERDDEQDDDPFDINLRPDTARVGYEIGLPRPSRPEHAQRLMGHRADQKHGEDAVHDQQEGNEHRLAPSSLSPGAPLLIAARALRQVRNSPSNDDCHGDTPPRAQ